MKILSSKTKNPHFVRTLIRFACTAFVLVSFLAPAQQAKQVSLNTPTTVSTSTLEGRLAVFDDLWATIQIRYYDPKFNGVNWETNRVTYRAAVAKANSTQEFYEIIRKMLGMLRDAHTRVYGPDEKFDWWSPRFITLGFTIREVEGSPTVFSVQKDSQAARAGIRPGDILTRIDNTPAAEFIARRLQTFDPPNDGSARFRAFANVLEGPVGSSVKVDWKNKDNQVRSAEFTRFWNQRQLGFSSQRQDGIAVIKIDAFTQSVALDFIKTIPQMVDDAEGVILDLRANGGGDAEAMADVASLFLENGTGLGRFSDRSGAAFELHTYLKRAWPSTSAIKLPLIVLTSESTSSAAEIMTSALQTKRGALVVGSRSCGCVLAIRNRHTLPDGGVLDVSEFDYRTPEGIRLEGRGINPNYTTTLNRKDLYAGRDRTLEVAKTLLKEFKTRK